METKHALVCLYDEREQLRKMFDNDVVCLLPGSAVNGVALSGASVTREAKRFLGDDPNTKDWAAQALVPRGVSPEAQDEIRRALGVADEQ